MAVREILVVLVGYEWSSCRVVLREEQRKEVLRISKPDRLCCCCCCYFLWEGRERMSECQNVQTEDFDKQKDVGRRTRRFIWEEKGNEGTDPVCCILAGNLF